MNYCTGCGEEIEAEDRYCSNCGTKQDQVTDAEIHSETNSSHISNSGVHSESNSSDSFKFALFAGGGAFVLVSVLLLMVGWADSRSTVTLGTWMFLSTLYGLPTGLIIGVFSYAGARFLK